MKKYIEALVCAASIALLFAFLFYLFVPAHDGELRYLAHLPAALSGLAFFAAGHYMDFVWAGLIALAALGLAFPVLEKIFRLRLPTGLMLGAGMGILGLTIFYLGVAHRLDVRLIRGVVIAFALFGIYFSFVRLRSLGKVPATSWLEAAIYLVFGVSVLLVLVHPTYFYDALYYHLALPRQYLIRNSIAPIPGSSYSYFPEIAEMLYLGGLTVSGQTAAQLVNLIFWLATILLVREIFQVLFGARFKMLAGLFLLALPLFAFLSYIITNDIVLAFFIAAGVYALVAEDLLPGRRALLFGILAGFACSIKLTAYLYMLVPQALWLAWLIFKQDRKKLARSAVISLAAFSFICAPFWVRNAVAVGNPFYPALSQLLGGPLNAEQSEALWHDASGVNFNAGIFRQAFSFPHDFPYAPASNQPTSAAKRFFPLYGTALPAGLILLLLRKPREKWAPVLVYCLAFWLAWDFSFRLARFSLGLWIILAVLAAGGFTALIENGKFLKRLAGFALVVALCSSFVIACLDGARINGWRMLTGKLPPNDYLFRLSYGHPVEMGAYPVYRWLNDYSASRANVAMLGPTLFFYLERRVYANSFIDQNPLLELFNQDQTPAEVSRFLLSRDIDYLIYQPRELDRLSHYPVNHLTDKGRKRMAEFLTSAYLEPVMHSDVMQIFLYQLARPVKNPP